MSTFLELCQDTARECGITSGGPSAVTGQTGELLRIVEWVARAYTEIQDARHWRWLRKQFTVDTVDGTDTYAYEDCTDVSDGSAITRFKAWRLNDRRNPPKLYLTSTGVSAEVFLSWVSWDNFEYLYKTGSIQNQTSQPVHITVDPNDDIRLGLTPGDVYTVTGWYHRSAQILAANGDTPEMPSDYHSLIMYEAMLSYADYESAPEVEKQAMKGKKRVMRQLIKNQGNPYRLGGPLA